MENNLRPSDYVETTGLHGFTEKFLNCGFGKNYTLESSGELNAAKHPQRSTFSKVIHVIALIALNILTLMALAIRACCRKNLAIEKPVVVDPQDASVTPVKFIQKRLRDFPIKENVDESLAMFSGYVEQNGFANEILPGLVLGGMHETTNKLQGIIRHDFNEKEFAIENASVLTGEIWDGPEAFVARTSFHTPKYTKMHEEDKKFDAVVVVQGKHKGETWPARDYTKESPEICYFTSQKLEMEGTNLKAEEFTSERIKKTVLFIDKMIGSGKRVYVHCHQGCDRSAAIVYGYLRYKFGRQLSEDQLIKFMNIQRRVANEFPKNAEKGHEDGKNIRDYYIVPVNAAVDELHQEQALLSERHDF